MTTDEDIRRAPRPELPFTQRVMERLTGKAYCDQCHSRQAVCTVPIFGWGSAARMRWPGDEAALEQYQPKRKEFWCQECRDRVFPPGGSKEYAWCTERGRF